MTVFPLTIPLTTVHGTIATSIALSANRPAIMWGALLSLFVSLLVAVAISLTILIAYSYSTGMARLFGREGTHTETRMSAFLLLCVGVQIVQTGVTEGIPPLLSAVR
jgi:multiple antibiotic resistance protein